MIHEWPRMWRREFAGYGREALQKDVLAGVTVAAVVPGTLVCIQGVGR